MRRSPGRRQFEPNCFDVETGDIYWTSDSRKDGQHGLYATHRRPVVDMDVWDEYWTAIRGCEKAPKSAARPR